MIPRPMLGGRRPTGTPDPFYPFVVCLLHAEDSLVEATGIPTSVSVVGGGAISSAQAKFGTKSFFNPGTTSESVNYIAVNNPAGSYVFTGEFTVEGWYYVTSLPSPFQNFCTNELGFPSAGYIQAAIQTDGAVFFSGPIGFAQTAAGAYTTLLNTWAHVAFARDSSNVLRIFFNGTQSASNTVAGTFGANSGGQSFMRPFRGHAGDNGDLNAYLEEFRVTNGVCRYTSNFTPPTEPFPDFGP